MFQLQMVTLVDAFKSEQTRLDSQRDGLSRAKAKVMAKRGKVAKSRKTVECAAKSLASAEKSFAKKLDEFNSIFDVSLKLHCFNSLTNVF